MASSSGHKRIATTLGLVGVGVAALMPAAEAATEVVTGVIRCTSDAPRTASMDGSNGIIEDELTCSSRPADGNCTEEIRRDLDDRGCAFRGDEIDGDRVLYFACSGPREDMIDLIDLVCRRLNGF